jgi:D-galactarolactone cycloisomerase
MKIVSIKVHVLQSPLSQPFAFSQGWVHRRSATLVEVSTDTGITVRRETIDRYRIN